MNTQRRLRQLVLALALALPFEASAEIVAVDPEPDPALAAAPAAPRPRERREWVEVGHGIRFGMGTRMIDVSARMPRIVYLGTDTGFIFRSLDGGVTWDELRLLPDDIPLLDVPIINPYAIPFPNDGLLDLFVASPPQGTFGLADRIPSRRYGGVATTTGRFAFSGTARWRSGSERYFATSYALGGSGARIETEDPGNLMALYFRGVGQQPGRVNWISICQSDPSVAFVGTHFGGYRTRDMGITWDRVFIGSSTGENQVRSVHCHPENANIIYLGTAEGMRTSRDGGESWERATGNFGVWPVNFVETHPMDRRRIVVGTDLGAYETITGDEFDEIYFADTPSPDVRVVTVVRPTTDEEVTYVGTLDGAAYTHDGGESWHRMGEFLIGHYRIRTIMVDPADAMHVYVVTDWHVFESFDGGASMVQMWPGYTGLKYAVLDPREPDDIWLVGYSQVWRYERPRRPRPGAASETTRRARAALRRDPGPYAVEDAALSRARLDARSIAEYRRNIRRSSLVPTLDVMGWGYLITGHTTVTGVGRASALTPYYTMGCRNRLVPNVCNWANPTLPMDVNDQWQIPHFGFLFVLSWPFGRAIMDERTTGRMWRDVFSMRNRVMYNVYDYWADRRRLLEYLAAGTATAAEEASFGLRLSEMSAVIDGLTNGIVGGPFGELDSWEVD